MTPINPSPTRNLRYLFHVSALFLLLLAGRCANAENETLYSYNADGFCVVTYDTINLTVTITVDASTPDGIYEFRMNHINQPAPDAYDPFCNFWVSNGIITAAEWSGSGIGTSAFTFGAGIASGTTQGGLRYYDSANYEHRVEWRANEGGVINTGPCPGPPGIVYTGAMTLNFGGRTTPTPTPTPRPSPGQQTTQQDKEDGGNKCKRRPPMALYSVHSMLVSLNIEDRPLRYSPAFGPPIDFTVTYNQKESQQPATFAYSNLGPKWTFNWHSYVSDDPNVQLPLTGVYVPGGGAEVFAFDSGSQTFVPDAQSHATLVKTGAASYERRLPDGSKQIFGLSDGAASYPRRIFMTQVVDLAGNSVTIGYDGSFRVTTITDALGQVTNLSYELVGDPLKITRVTDPFGRFATFEYTNGQTAFRCLTICHAHDAYHHDLDEKGAVKRELFEVVECARLIKGYGDTYARGLGNFRQIEARLIAPALAGRDGAELHEG